MISEIRKIKKKGVYSNGKEASKNSMPWASSNQDTATYTYMSLSKT